MKKIFSNIKHWSSAWYGTFTEELRNIFNDSGVLIVFFVAGLGYPLLFGLIFKNGTIDDMPIAVVDNSHSLAGREFSRTLDATPEISAKYHCTNMEEAQSLMRQRKVHGIVMIPEDFGDCLARGGQAHVSTYADMSSFLYYKNLTMGTNMAMLHEMHRHSGLPQPVRYEANLPYNRNLSYTIFFIAAVLPIVIQQTMFYGVSMLSGTMREENRNMNTSLSGRGAAYWLLYMGIGTYTLSLVPEILGLPQNCGFGSIFVLLLFYVTACVAFSFTFSSMIRHRETVFILFLFMSPICLFLTGFSWPTSSFPRFWKIFSYIFPSTFATRAFININSAGASLGLAVPQLTALAVQTIAYYILSNLLLRHTARSKTPDLCPGLRQEAKRSWKPNPRLHPGKNGILPLCPMKLF